MGRPDASSRDGRTTSHRGGLLTAAAVTVAAAAAVLRRLSPRHDAVDVVNAPASRRWETLASAVSSALRPRGLDVVAPLRLRWYNDIAPPSAKIAPGGRLGDDALVILVGNSRALWPAFCAAHDSDPDVGDAEDPVDTYVAREVDRAVAPLAVAHRNFYAHETKPGRLVAVQRMAHVAGVAHLDERCHLSIHPSLGPWFALRAVVVLDDVEGPGDDQKPKPPPNPLAADPIARARVDAAFDEALAGYERADAADGQWRRWVAVRDAVSPEHPARYHDDQVLYHYNCLNGAERERIRSKLRGFERRTEQKDDA